MTGSKDINPENVDRPTGLLTPSQRIFLKENIDTTGSAVRERRRKIRQKFYNAIFDFSLIVEYCRERETDREQVFDVSRHDSPEEFLEFERGLANMIRFIYAGMASTPDFESILRHGIRNAEVDLGNVDSALFVNVDFGVEYATARSPTETAKHIKNDEWDQVTAPDVFVFLRTAELASNSFDIDEIVRDIENVSDHLKSEGDRNRDEE